MRLSTYAAGASALATLTFAQSNGKYCDNLGRCFASHTDRTGTTYGIAIPETSTAPFDAIIQITAPKKIGWAGVAWGGQMNFNPLTISWPNEDKVMVSGRVAYAFAIPPVYENAPHTLLEGSYVNETHWVMTSLCRGCSSWEELGSTPSSINPTKQARIALAYSTRPVNNPDNLETTFAIHEESSVFDLDFSQAQSKDFAQWIAHVPTNPTTTATDGSPTATGGPSIPIPTGPLPIPTSCDLKGQFPLEAAEGWSYVKIAGDLKTPRALLFDTKGSLLVVQVGVGLSVHTFSPDGCIASSKILIEQKRLTHGVALNVDGTQLYVSSAAKTWRYTYDAETQSVSDEEVVVKGMFPGGHTARTLVIPPATPDFLAVMVGSDGNLDQASFQKETGRAVVKVFDMAAVPNGGWDYNTEGWFLGYGLRNDVALAVDNNNMVWGVENSADEFDRIVGGEVTDIHNNNPAEELNYLGDPSKENTDWYGYPTCFTVWDGTEFKDTTFQTGAQFIPEPNSTWTDALCAERSVPPRLSFQAHSAPIDAKFDPKCQNLYVTLHGSWNRDTPTGYKVVAVPFKQNCEGGFEPVAAPDSTDGYVDVLWDPQEDCDSSKCFRPSGLTWDRGYSRLVVASDNSKQGELYVLSKKA